MAFVMPYTFPDSTEQYANSYWMVIQANLSPLTQTGVLIFGGWATQADHDAGLPPRKQHSYTLTPAGWAQAIATLGWNPAAGPAYTLAAAIPDTVITPAVVDKNGAIATPAVMGSFFNGASVV